MSIKIGIILRYLWIAGAPKIAVYQVQGLIKQGYLAELIILAMSPKYRGEYDSLLHKIPYIFVTVPKFIEKIELVLNNKLFGKWRPEERLIPLASILLAVKHVAKYDILLCHDPFSGFLGLLAKVLLRKPYVVYLHETPFGNKYFIPFERIILRLADAIFAVSEKVVEEINISIRHKVALPPGLPTERSDKQKVEKIILTVARWDRDRRPDWIVKIAKEMENFTFFVSGYWQSKNLYEEFVVKSRNIKNLIVCQKPIKEEELGKLLSLSLVVIRFNPLGEALGMIAWEAVHKGVPVIVNSSLGVARYIKTFNAGIVVVNIDDIKSIKEALIEISKNYQQYAENCLKLGEYYNVENQSKRLAELLRSTIKVRE